MQPIVVDGDILEQRVDAIVNAWNRNIIPWWLLIPQGVSGAIKKRAGNAPFRELARAGAISLGGAVLTSAGALPYKGIIHVAGIDLLWRASKRSIQQSVLSAMEIVKEQHFSSVAFPVIGAGSGCYSATQSIELMEEVLRGIVADASVYIVRYQPRNIAADGNPGAQRAGY